MDIQVLKHRGQEINFIKKVSKKFFENDFFAEKYSIYE
jgi:hypothetical protein